MIKYKHDFEQSSELHRLTIPVMKQYEIPLTPNNYALWYTYTTGEIQELNEVIDDIIEKEEKFTQKFCDDLYRAYIAAPDEEKLGVLQKNVLQILEVVHNCIAEGDKEASKFEQVFSQHKQTLLSVDDISVKAVKEIVDSLVEDTRAMKDVGKKLHTQLKESGGEIKQLRQQLEIAHRYALTDPLTGLSNRHAFDMQVKESLEEYDSTSLVLLDVDNFKVFNDTHGHLLGDKVLQLVAGVIKQCIKGRDIAIRFGGEEFAVVLPGTPLTGAVKVAEQIRIAIEKTKLIKKEDRTSLGKVTVSAGVAEYHEQDNIENLIDRADKALYKSKHEGRNRVSDETQL